MNLHSTVEGTPQRGPVVVRGIPGALELIGMDLGWSDWMSVDQTRVNQFADATGDDQWIHVDVGRAARGPYGGTVAHGYLTLSLMPAFMRQLLQFEGFATGVNYGCDRVRFPSPVRTGQRIRGGAIVDSVAEVPGGVQVQITLTVEIEGGAKPACVAKLLSRRYV